MKTPYLKKLNCCSLCKRAQDSILDFLLLSVENRTDVSCFLLPGMRSSLSHSVLKAIYFKANVITLFLHLMRTGKFTITTILLPLL